jgi:hypothetical protein
MSNGAWDNMDSDTKATLHDLEIDRLEHQAECVAEGRHTVRLTDRQLWFLKCACEARTAILPLLPTQLIPETFNEDYGISQKDMTKEVERLSIKLKAI